MTTQYGLDTDIFKNESGIPARITAVHRGEYEIFCEHGISRARIKSGNFYTGEELIPTTGDYVMLEYHEGNESRILKTLPRKTLFERLDPSSSGHYSQAVAANFDYVFIVQSLNHDFNPQRLERYVAMAWQSGAVPVVVLTKADCAQTDTAAYISRAETHALGVDIHAVSAFTGIGLEGLEKYLQPGKTIVLLGSSGVGKSTLLNALAGEEVMQTGAIREKDERGRHTTTHRQLIMLKNNAVLIDTPGMRELGLWDAAEGVEQSFSDIEQFLCSCKFSDCHHQGEPGCAVQKALISGELSSERWKSYLKLKAQAKHEENKQEYLRLKTQRTKEIAIYAKKLKKYGKK